MITTATVPENAKVVSYLTNGKTYQVVEDREHGFDIIDDQGERITALKENDIQLGFTCMGDDFKNWLLS